MWPSFFSLELISVKQEGLEPYLASISVSERAPQYLLLSSSSSSAAGMASLTFFCPKNVFENRKNFLFGPF